jgi:hypothetical protein
MSDDIDGLDGMVISPDGQIVGGGISGRMVRAGGEAGSIGVVRQGRSSSEPNVRLAARFWPRAMASEFQVLDNGLWRSRSSDLLFEPIASDPLFTVDSPDARAEDLASCFVATENGIVFLRMTGQTLQAVEQAEAASAAATAKEQQALAKRRLKEELTAISAAEVHAVTPAFSMTLRSAAAAILDSGGKIDRGTFGEVRVQVPARLTFDPLSEAGARRELAAAAAVLVHADRAVIYALEHGSEKLRLDERLDDRLVSAGGGVV